MKDIFTILSESGVEVGEELKKPLLKAVGENYRTIAEFQKKIDRIAELETQNGELSEQIKAFDGDKSKLEELQNKVADYEKAEQKRREEQQAAELENSMRERFKGLNGEHKYINEYTEKAVFEDFKAAVADKANAGKSDADIYSQLVKDKNIYQNPNTVVVPPVGGGSSSDKKTIEELSKLSYDEYKAYRNKN